MGSYDGSLEKITDNNLVFDTDQAFTDGATVASGDIINLKEGGTFGIPLWLKCKISGTTTVVSSGKTAVVQLVECATVDGTYTEVFRKSFTNEDCAGEFAIGIAKCKQFLKVNTITSSSSGLDTVILESELIPIF